MTIKMPRDWAGTLAPGSYVFRHGKWVPRSQAKPLHPKHGRGPMFMPDIQAFKSPIDGTTINTRRAVREHERRHNVIQVGNERVGDHGTREPDTRGIERELADAFTKSGM